MHPDPLGVRAFGIQRSRQRRERCTSASWTIASSTSKCYRKPYCWRAYPEANSQECDSRVCIYFDHKVPCKLLEFCDQDGVESIWILIRPNCLPGHITSIVLGVIYHSTSNREPENVILREHVQKNLDALLAKQPKRLFYWLVILTSPQQDFRRNI